MANNSEKSGSGGGMIVILIAVLGLAYWLWNREPPKDPIKDSVGYATSVCRAFDPYGQFGGAYNPETGLYYCAVRTPDGLVQMKVRLVCEDLSNQDCLNHVNAPDWNSSR